MRPVRTSSRSSRRDRVARDRRGATLVMIAISLVMLLGFVGVGIDFAKAYAARTRLKTAADAAAMAGAVELARAGRPTAATTRDSALKYANLNVVEGTALAAVPVDDVQAVQWDFTTRQVVLPKYGSDFANANVNAVEVTARYSDTTIFAIVLGQSQIALRERTVAALGGVGTQDCIKPMAVSYLTLLKQLYPTNTPAVTYNLTQADVTTLSQNTTPIGLLQGSGDPTAPGNIGQVVTYTSGWPKTVTDENGSDYARAVGSNSCTDLAIGPGNVLATDPGNGSGQTAGPIADFCARNGGTNPAKLNGNKPFDCLGQPVVKLALWDTNNGQSGNNLTYHVKYVGVFRVTGYGANAGGCTAGSAAQVCGYFSTMATNGGFVGSPGLTQKAAIVF